MQNFTSYCPNKLLGCFDQKNIFFNPTSSILFNPRGSIHKINISKQSSLFPKKSVIVCGVQWYLKITVIRLKMKIPMLILTTCRPAIAPLFVHSVPRTLLIVD